MKSTPRRTLLTMAALLVGLFGGTACADVGWFTAKVVKTLVRSDGIFGGCMAALSVDPASVLPSCSANWVTFSCTGDFGSILAAHRQLDQAQLALAGDHTVFIELDDSRKHNGYCFVTRIDVIK